MRPKLPPLVVGKRSHPGKIHFHVGPSCAMAEEMKGRVIGGESIAEEYFSPFRRAEIGIQPHNAGAYLLPASPESSRPRKKPPPPQGRQSRPHRRATGVPTPPP